MDASDLRLRNRTYAFFVEQGRAPTARELAGDAGLAEAEVVAAWRRLHDAHALVLDAGRGDIRMANPFAAVPTPHRVRADGRWWYANCAWDAFGVCAALQTDGRIESSCPDCASPIAFDVRDGMPSARDLLFHCLVPAAQWWEDIVFT